MPYSYDYPRPALTVDVVLLTPREQRLRVLLIKRKSPPFAERWALPGGFMDIDEDLPDAARRELLEETGVRAGKLLELGVYGKPGRDPRGRTVSVAYLALRADRTPELIAADDAAEAGWFNLQRPPPLAFDHRYILAAARRRLRELLADPPQLRQRLLSGRGQDDQLAALLQAAGADRWTKQ